MIQARVNNRITAKVVRVLDKTGDEIGVFSLADALNLACSRNEDLIEVGPAEEPPLCKIMDYGEYRWQLQQKQKKRANG